MTFSAVRRRARSAAEGQWPALGGARDPGARFGGCIAKPCVALAPEVPTGVETGRTTAVGADSALGTASSKQAPKMNLDGVIRLSGYIPLAIHNETGIFPWKRKIARA
jgi:hypothetical protein